jgi:hypothetical protein
VLPDIGEHNVGIHQGKTLFQRRNRNFIWFIHKFGYGKGKRGKGKKEKSFSLPPISRKVMPLAQAGKPAPPKILIFFNRTGSS